MSSGCGVLRDECLQLLKCTLSKTPSLKVGGREEADCPGCESPPSPVTFHLSPKPAPPEVSPSSLVAAPSFWTLKPKIVETSLTPLLLSHPDPIPLFLVLPSKYIQDSTPSHLHCPGTNSHCRQPESQPSCFCP